MGEGISVDKLMIKSITKDYVNNHDSFNFSITFYFISKFIERHNLKFRNLHGDSQATSIDNYESFFMNMKKFVKIIFRKIFIIQTKPVFFIRNRGEEVTPN